MLEEQPIEETIDATSLQFKPRADRIRVRKHIRNFSYYNQAHALALKIVVDKMLVDKKPRTFNAKSHRKSLRTLYIMLTRSLYYLADFLDTPENTYETFQRHTIWKQDEQADTLTLKYRGPGEEDVKPSSKPDSKPWREPFDNFIEEAEVGMEINIEGLRLEDSDMDYIIGSLLGLEDIVKVVKLDKTTIKMKRI